MGISNHKLIPPLHPPPRGAQPVDTPLLILAEPRLQRLPQDALADKVDDQAADDAHKRDGVHPVYLFMEDLDPDDHAPEVAGQQTDVEERRRREAEHDRSARIEEEQAERIPGQVPSDFSVVPDGLSVARSVKDARHGPVDEHAPEPQLADDLVERSLADQELLRHITHAVESGAHQREQIAFELVASGDAAEAGTLGDMVAAEENADAADADEDADDLGGVVADMEEYRGDEDDHYDSPEVNELSGEDCSVGLLALRLAQAESYRDLRISISKHSEVIPLDIQKCQNNVFPTILKHELDPSLPAIPVDCIRAIDQGKKDVIPQCLKRRDGKGLRSK